MNQKRILVVEDDSAIRQGIVDALQFAGYEALQAANGNDGMTEALRASVDLLLLDLILPGQNGFDILKATREAGRCELSEREVELLRYLASNAGRAISRDEILMRVWRLNPKRMETRTIDMHVANLREKLRDDADEPKVLLTVRGKGYMFRK